MTATARVRPSAEVEPAVGPGAATLAFIGTVVAVSPRRAAVVVLLSLIRGLLPLAMVAVLAVMVDQVARLIVGDQAAAQAAGIAIAAQAVLQIVSISVAETIRSVQRRLELLLRFEVERRLMSKLISIDIQQLEGPSAFARVARLRTAGQAAVGLMNALLTGLVASVTLVTMLTMVLRIHLGLSALLLLIVTLLLALQVRAGQDRFARGMRVQGAEVRASYWFNLLTNPLAALDLRAYQLGPWIQRRWEGLVIAAAEESSSAGAAQDRVAVLLQVLGTAASLALSALLLWLANARLLTVGSFVAAGAVLVQTVSATQQLGQSIGSAVEGALAHADLLRFGVTLDDDAHVPLPTATLRQRLEVDRVTFRYRSTAAPALRNVSCSVRKGERVLLVGPNGAGKSTFVRLVAGLYAPETGRVLYDGVDLTSAVANPMTASLLQGYLYYDTTVAENIALGDVDRASDRRAVISAAQKARIDDVIGGWPQGYENGLGQWLFTDGVIPSQGQRVRLALARAFFRDAALYILDEPTAGLDPEAARQIADAIDHHTRGRTAFIVSHDLDLWTFLDRVVVFERGEIVADGPRAALAERSEWLKGVIGNQAERLGEFDARERPYWS